MVKSKDTLHGHLQAIMGTPLCREPNSLI